MIRRLSAIFAYLELGADELQMLVQWAGVAVVAAAVLIACGVVLGVALRAFTCVGGIHC